MAAFIVPAVRFHSLQDGEQRGGFSNVPQHENLIEDYNSGAGRRWIVWTIGEAAPCEE